MRIDHRGVSEGLQRIPLEAVGGHSANERSSGMPDVSAPNDAVQLSYLSGVLNSLQTDAKNSAAKIDSVSRLIQQNEYQVDAIAISRKLIATSLQ